MLVNAEETGVSSDTKYEIAEYWKENGLNRRANPVHVLDKGFGYLRAWMDLADEDAIHKAAVFMMQHNIHDSRQIETKTDTTLEEVLGSDYSPALEGDPLILNWLDWTFLKRNYNDCGICGGARHECLAEVRIMFDILGIRYRLMDEFIYS